MELRDQDQEPSSCEVQADAPPAQGSAAEEQQVGVTKEDEEIARCALAERMAKKHPTRSPPRWFDSSEVALVAACAAALEGDADAKMTAQRDAIAGAFLVSREAAPTVRFIWEKLDHFFDHVERGRRRRLADDRAVRLHASRAPTPTAPTVHRPFAGASREQMSADLERIFGAGWKICARAST